MMAVMVAVAALSIIGAYMFIGHKAEGGAAGFVRACVLPDEPTDERCRSKSAIKAAWDIDIDQMIEQRRVLMVSTVRRMVSGELIKRDVYQNCIIAGECAPVPMLPDHIDSAALASTTAYLDTRKAFWQLADDSPLTPEICTFMDICRAMRAAGVVTVP
jgi:hypothetical protein